MFGQSEKLIKSKNQMGINKKITWWEPEFGEEEAKAVHDVVKSGYVNEDKL